MADAAVQASPRKRGMARRNAVIYTVAVCLIAAILVVYAHVAASEVTSGPPPGFHIVSAFWGGGVATADVPQPIDILVSNGQDHAIRLQWIELVPAASLRLHPLTFQGRVRTVPWSTVHAAPGPWLRWRHGPRLLLGSGLTLRPGVGLHIEGKISYPGSHPGRIKQPGTEPLVAGFRLHYREQSTLHDQVVPLPRFSRTR